MTRALAPLAVTLTMFLTVGAVQANTIRVSDHPGCDLELRGEIRRGAAEALDMDRVFDMVERQVSLSEEGYVLCLDSPGGSLAEAMAMFEAISEKNITTRIPAGWRCESACAIAFMAGSLTLGLGVPVTDRSHRLDPGGSLGFHAPSLQLSGDGLYSTEEIGRSFELALEAASRLYRSSLQERGGWRSFNEYLYARLLETPSDRMYRIDTIGDAILADITLGPADLPQQITEREIAHLCDAAYLTERAPSEMRIPDGAAELAWKKLHGTKLPKETRDWLQEARHVELTREGGSLIGRVGGYDRHTVYAYGCQVKFDASAVTDRSSFFDDFASSKAVSVRFYFYYVREYDDATGTSQVVTRWQPDPDYLQAEIHVPLWFMHDPATPLSSLVPKVDTPLEHPGATHVVHTQPGWMVNIRTGPGTDHPVLREVAHGTVVMQLMYNGDGWARVELSDGTAGWVAAGLLAPL